MAGIFSNAILSAYGNIMTQKILNTRILSAKKIKDGMVIVKKSVLIRVSIEDDKNNFFEIVPAFINKNGDRKRTSGVMAKIIPI